MHKKYNCFAASSSTSQQRQPKRGKAPLQKGVVKNLIDLHSGSILVQDIHHLQSPRSSRVQNMGCYKLSAPILRLVNILIWLVNILINRFSKKEKKTMLHLLPPDIIEDILLRLPPKTISQCMCVSKLWYSVIKDPHFTKQLYFKQKHNRKLMFTASVAKVYSLDYEASTPKVVAIDHSSNVIKLRFQGYAPGNRIWGYYRGFLCIWSLGTNTLFLWNPYTREYKRVPDTPKHPPDDPLFDRCHFMYMVGYDAATQDYIVVRVFNYMKSGRVTHRNRPGYESHSEVEVYSSRKNLWRRMGDIPYVVGHLSRGVFVNGSFFWVAKQNSQLVIVSYKVKTERIREVSLPHDVDRAYNSITVSSLKGCLCVVFHYGEDYNCKERNESHGWILKGFSWINIFQLPDYNIVPLSILKNDKELLLVNDKVGLYLLNCRGIRKLEIPNCPRGFPNATIYTESFVPLYCS